MGTRTLRTGLKLESVSQMLTTAVLGPISSAIVSFVFNMLVKVLVT